ncbi:COG3650 family protein [Paracoccus aestuarii]|uniref:COG3650 family protein n=1 Tax=Paracoccus aestuarii TaxID=453842 RepID=UPI00147567A2|nr:hypothetical protein [Paracoccus aestuarii]WCQ98527.1 hypothetical protein JHW48_11505 [Paracoccus aestuarii]
MSARPSARLAMLALLTLPLAACDSEAMTDLRRGVGLDRTEEAQPAQPEGPRPPAVSPLVEPIETGAEPPRALSTAEPLTYRATAFVARGNEPDWNVQISGNTATYRTPDTPNGRQIQVNRLVFDRGVEYIGVLNGRPFVVNMRAAPCQDTMSDERFPLTARLTVTGQTRTGCAAPGVVPTAPQAASQDAPQAAAGAAPAQAG